MKIDILVYPGCDELDVFGPFEALSAAKKAGADFDIQLVSLYNQEFTTASHGIKFETKSKFQVGNQDIVIVPGGSWHSKGAVGAWAEFEKGFILKKLKELNDKNIIFVGVCTGTMLLAHAGIIAGRRASTHHTAWDDLAALGAEVIKERVVIGGDNLFTAGGVTSGIDMGIYLTKRFGSLKIAQEVSALLEYPSFFPE
jgi:transcriptional regulator GlxA family with amidase domain